MVTTDKGDSLSRSIPARGWERSLLHLIILCPCSIAFLAVRVYRSRSFCRLGDGGAANFMAPNFGIVSQPVFIQHELGTVTQ